MIIALFPGSFKPPHSGHLQVIKSLPKNTNIIYIIISQKPRSIPNYGEITAKTSYDIWKLYISTLPINLQNKIKIIIANQPSPILFGYVLVKNKIKPTDTLLLLKSQKDEKNKRFSMFDNLDCKKNIIVIPTFKKFNSTSIRELISLKKWKQIEEYIPKKVQSQTIDILKNL